MFYIFAEDQFYAIEAVNKHRSLLGRKWKFVRSREDIPLLVEVGSVVLGRGWNRNPSYDPALLGFLRDVERSRLYGSRLGDHPSRRLPVTQTATTTTAGIQWTVVSSAKPTALG